MSIPLTHRRTGPQPDTISDHEHHAPPPFADDMSTRSPTLSDRLSALLPQRVATSLQRSSTSILSAKSETSLPRYQKTIRKGQQRLTVGAIFSLPNALIVLWTFLLWWGEVVVFRSSAQDCQWKSWERWPSGSSPHRLLFVADPQLIDPHTYPGRPWPLSTLTIMHTDNYLRRSYKSLQRILNPDTTFFLGDLFDGGREWKTTVSKSSEPRWKRYGNQFWLREYDRFGRIFFSNFAIGGYEAGEGQRGKKIVAGLPGNHDLGLGVGIQLSVRARFNAYFGDGNRVDVIANHTFVSVDTVSLSAKDQADPLTGTQGSGLGDGPQSEKDKIWRVPQDFINSVQQTKRRAVDRELRYQAGLPARSRAPHSTSGLGAEYKVQKREKAETPNAELPSILLTHVPLYRPRDTPCGPLREKYPPSPRQPGEDPPEKDPRNALLVQGGYQYQNVLTPEISSELVEKVGNVAHVFSGDDHDYCELRHKSYTGIGGGVKEITVKSISWAMGVRKPGVVLLSLWNPIDSTGNPIRTQGGGHGGGSDAGPTSPTMESHLCLLPDQLGIFTRYLLMFGFTLIALGIRTVIRRRKFWVDLRRVFIVGSLWYIWLL